MEVVVENNTYEVITNYRDGFDKDEFISKCTDYFYDYDYIVGDIAYSKLRLKGFYDSKNKKAKKLNDFKYLDEYLEKYCANDCRYFVVRKINK